jgi:peptidoglycan/LPS O-acetylase OafA/YrhL
MIVKREHVPFLDHIRGIAILLVCAVHSFSASGVGDPMGWRAEGLFRNVDAPVWVWLALPVQIGWIGVPIFFVISGFCIHLSHERSRKKAFSIFFVRRFFRIYPPYFAAVLFFAFVLPYSRLHFHAAFLKHDHAALQELSIDLFSHLFLIQNLANEASINFSFWSIAVEAQLYLLYPLLLAIAHRVGWKKALWITAGIELGGRALLGAFCTFDPGESFTAFPLIYWFSWATGAAIAEAYLKGGAFPFLRAPLAAICVLFLACYFFRPLYPFCFPLAALAAATVVCRLLNGSALVPTSGLSGILMSGLERVGLVSYSFYLIHQPLLFYLPELVTRILHFTPAPLPMFVLCLLALPLIFGVSYLVYRTLEIPSIEYGKQVIRDRFESLRPQR